MTVRNPGPSGQRGESRESGDSEPRASHFSPRTGLIGLYAAFAAVLVGALTYAGHPALAPSVVTGALTLAGAFVFFDKIIGD
jgi:hypothetical protein